MLALIIILPVELLVGFVKINILPFHITAALLIRTLLFPAFVEEFIFRGLLWPKSERINQNYWLGVVFSFMSFIVYHLLLAVIFPSIFGFFFKFGFLYGLLILGLSASYLRHKSSSLWPPIIYHWLVDFVLLAFLNGHPALVENGLNFVFPPFV
jgi:predicted Abi (CAAX) family protease